MPPMKKYNWLRKKAANKKSSKSKKKSKLALCQADYDPEEEMLRKFDMDMTYGPCVGVTRLERWERAQKMGLNPPQEIERFLKSDKDIKVQLQCLWNKKLGGNYKIIEYYVAA